MKSLCVSVLKPYEIKIQSGLLKNCGTEIKKISKAKTLCIISDSNVYPLYGDTVKKSLENEGYNVLEYVFEAGEMSKNSDTLLLMVEFMAEHQMTRNDMVIALGGGVCGDMAGFAASIYLRGIDFVQIPTSLLAQIDSSVGGKTAIDLKQGKNLCGAFHQPRLVLIDPDVLATLSPHYFSDGMAEAIKYGCIRSEKLFNRILNEDASSFIEKLIFECVDIKRQIVENDEKEHGERALLNFGHTAGHAIEKLWNFEGISHGEAVGIGMVLICEAGEKQGLTMAGTANRVKSCLEKYNLKTTDTHKISEIVKAMDADKKRTGFGINFVMLKSIGDSFLNLVSYDKIDDLFGV